MSVQSSRQDPVTSFTVLHLVQPVEGGVAKVVTDLVTAQRAEGFRVVVACPPQSPLARAVAGAGAEVRPWAATRAPGSRLVAETRRAAAIIRAVRPDLVHAHSAKAGLAGRLAVRGRLPTVFQPHAWSFEAVGGATGRLALAWERYAARWTHRLICVSDAERRSGERAGITAPCTVVHNGVNATRFTPPAVGASAPLPSVAARGLLPPRQGAPGDRSSEGAPVVVCVGRLCRQKGQDVLLRAWPQVTALVPRARLVLVGDGPDAAVLRAGAPESVIFAGPVPDTAPWYRAAHVAVLPSRWEGMALAPLEAMACGRPVVLTDVDGARETLPAGHAAHCLVPPEDPAALAAALGALLQDAALRADLGRQAHHHVLSTFDVRRTARATADVYRDVAAAPHPDRREPIAR
jgi:glycosyltransferase involved in cell wall biosynthesis